MLQGYSARIAGAQDQHTLRRLQKEVARKLVWATQVLRSVSDGYWQETLEDYASHFASLCPGKAEQLALFLAHARPPWAPGDVFNAKLLQFTGWMQHTQRAQACA